MYIPFHHSTVAAANALSQMLVNATFSKFDRAIKKLPSLEFPESPAYQQPTKVDYRCYYLGARVHSNSYTIFIGHSSSATAV